MNKLSIVIPVYYNEKNLHATYDQLKVEVLDKLHDYELIFVDDGSTDNSYQIMHELRTQDEKIKLIKLTRNFGQHSAIFAGFIYASGDCITSIAADLQDPPELILQMYERWQQGEKVVFSARRNREEKFIDKIFISIADKVNRLIFRQIPKNGIGFPLVDKSVAKILIEMDERNSSIHYQLLWLGYHKDYIYFDRKKRTIGKSSWSFSKKLKMLLDLTLSFSYFPIRLISLFGLIDCLLSGIGIIYIIFQKIFIGSSDGWSSLMIAIMFTSGVQMLTLGVIGEYLWRNFDAVRKRPVFVVEQAEGLDEP